MNETCTPKFAWGQLVQATVDLYNDGSLPAALPDQLLIAAGGPGEVVKIGTHAETRQPLYLVDFGLCVLGCHEDELAPMPEAAPIFQTPREVAR